MKLQPTSNHVLLDNPQQNEEISEGGIVVPQGAELKGYEISKILALGPEVNRLANGDQGPEIIAEGGKAIYAKGEYVTIEIGDEVYRVVAASRICAVINGESSGFVAAEHKMPLAKYRESEKLRQLEENVGKIATATKNQNPQLAGVYRQLNQE